MANYGFYLELVKLFPATVYVFLPVVFWPRGKLGYQKLNNILQADPKAMVAHWEVNFMLMLRCLVPSRSCEQESECY